MSCSRVSMFFAATAIRRYARLHVAARRRAVQAAAVGVAAPDRVDLGEVGVVAPVAGVDQRQQPGAVRARAWSRRSGSWPAAGRRARRGRPARARARSSARRARRGRRPAAPRRRAARRRAGTRRGRSRRCARVTSMRGPAQLGERDRPRGRSTRRDASSHTGRTPSSASTSAMSSPCGAHRATCPTPTGRPTRVVAVCRRR